MIAETIDSFGECEGVMGDEGVPMSNQAAKDIGVEFPGVKKQSKNISSSFTSFRVSMVASETSKTGKRLRICSSLTSQSFIKRLIQENYKFFTGVPCSLLSGLIYELEGQTRSSIYSSSTRRCRCGIVHRGLPCRGDACSPYAKLWVRLQS